MFASLFQRLRWGTGSNRNGRVRRHKLHRGPTTPRLEALEDRTLLSTFVVDRLTDSGAGTGLAGDLRYCISQANSSPGDDTITFEVTGTINLASVLPNLNSNIDLQGPGAVALIVSGQRATGGYFGIFTVSSVAAVVISGLTIAKGLAGAGGGVNNIGTLTVSNSIITGNWAEIGAGIYNRGGLTIIDSTVSRNSAGDGGGILNEDGTLTVSRSTISGNSANAWIGTGSGAGILNGRGTLVVTESTISDNLAASWADGGGGIYNGLGTVTVRNSTISGNRASYGSLGGNGGGIWNFGTLSISNSTLAGNISGDGGGINNS